MKRSQKKIKDINELTGKKTFFFPDSLSNDRMRDTHEKCIFLRINGENHYIMTGIRVELTPQEFAVLRDSGMVTSSYTYASRPEFDPIGHPYEIDLP